MPEVVEVEFLKNETALTFKGKRVIEAVLNNEKISNIDKILFSKILTDETLVSTDRHGKILILNFTNNKHLLIHFLLTGYMKLIKEEEKDKSQAYLAFDNGLKCGIFGIMFQGFVKFYQEEDIHRIDEVAKLGVDVLSKDFTLEKFEALIAKFGNRTIKDLLIDQEIIAGLGNAYSDEVLFLSKVHPKRKCRELKKEEIEIIYNNIFAIIEKAKRFGGASELSFVHLDGKRGEFHEHFLVHKKERCPICGSEIKTISASGRKAYFCPLCQK